MFFTSWRSLLTTNINPNGKLLSHFHWIWTTLPNPGRSKSTMLTSVLVTRAPKFSFRLCITILFFISSTQLASDWLLTDYGLHPKHKNISLVPDIPLSFSCQATPNGSDTWTWPYSIRASTLKNHRHHELHLLLLTLHSVLALFAVFPSFIRFQNIISYSRSIANVLICIYISFVPWGTCWTIFLPGCPSVMFRFIANGMIFSCCPWDNDSRVFSYFFFSC